MYIVFVDKSDVTERSIVGVFSSWDIAVQRAELFASRIAEENSIAHVCTQTSVECFEDHDVATVRFVTSNNPLVYAKAALTFNISKLELDQLCEIVL